MSCNSKKNGFTEIIKKIKYKTFLSFTYALFGVNEKLDEPELFGSCIIVRYNDKCYLITAKHVIDEIRKYGSRIYISSKKMIIELPIDNVYNGIITEPSDMDITYSELDFNFIVEYQLGYYELKKRKNKIDFTSVSMMGYPIKKNKRLKSILPENRFLLTPFLYTGLVENDLNLLAKYKKNDLIHSAVIYHKDINGNTLIKPQGCSGCGLWGYDAENNTYELCGILIEYHYKGKIIVYTKIEGIIYLLDKLNGNSYD